MANQEETVQTTTGDITYKAFCAGFRNATDSYQGGEFYMGKCCDEEHTSINSLTFSSPVPQGKIIVSAKLQLFLDTNTNYDFCENENLELKISAEDVDNSTVPTSLIDLEGRVLTTAKVDWDHNFELDDECSWVDSPDITTVIQEVVNRVGYAEDNNLTVFIKDDGSTPGSAIKIFSVFEEFLCEHTEAPKLYIEWEDLAPDTEINLTSSLTAESSMSASIMLFEGIIKCTPFIGKSGLQATVNYNKVIESRTWITDNLGAVPWKVGGQANKITYNEGNKLSVRTNPLWDIAPNTKTPITTIHNPCGYWYKDAVLYSLYGTGKGGRQLGLGNSSITFTYTPVESASTFIAVSCGNYHSAVIKSDGTLWTTGWNGHGQLGLGLATTAYLNTFTQVGTDLWLFVNCGYDQTMAIKQDGTLWAWGYNSKGELGLGDTTMRDSPEQVGSATWNSVSCGFWHSLAISSDGTLWGAGDNKSIGLGATGIHTSLTQVNTDNWAQVSCGYSSSICIKSDGTLWGSGDNGDGQIGLALDISSVSSFTQAGVDTWKAVSLYYLHTLLINTDGSLWVCGRNNEGQLGTDPDVADEIALVQINSGIWDEISVGWYCSFGIKSNGALWGSGYTGNGALGIKRITEHPYYKYPFFNIHNGPWKYVEGGYNFSMGIIV